MNVHQRRRGNARSRPDCGDRRLRRADTATRAGARRGGGGRFATGLAAPSLVVLLLLGSAAAVQNTPLGLWKLQVEWIGGAAEVTLTVSQVGSQLYAAWEGPRGKLAVRDVAFEKDVLSFVLPVQDQNGAPVELRFEGAIDGDAIDGKILLRNGTEINADGRRDSGAEDHHVLHPFL